MPRVEFATENKTKDGNDDYPRLKLKFQERALIIAIEKTPMTEFVHTLRAPEIGPDGNVLKEIKDGKRGQYEQVKQEFIGQHICFGNFDVLSAQGVDPDGCPTCAAAVEGNGIEAPKQRYAMHIIRYALKPNNWELKDPFGVTCEAWVFPASRFNQLVDFAADWKGLQKNDIKLGPCENEGFQKYDINIVNDAKWLDSDHPDRMEKVKAEYNNNKSEDLSVLIARHIEKSRAQEDIARVKERFAQAYGGTPTQSKSSVATADLTSMLSSDDSKPSDNVQDPWATPTATEAESAAPFATESASSGLSFDELMKDL